MSYDKMMRWHKKHPRGGKPQYMGFDTGYRKPPPEPTVFLKLTVPNGEWIPIETMTVSEAFKAHPDAIHFARLGVWDDFRCDGPAKRPTE